MATRLEERLQRLLGPDFVLGRELAGGGMSRVYVAHEAALKRDVVIKVLPPDLVSSESLARFQREIEFTARLQHPHILPVIRAGGEGDLLFYVTPYIHGQSLLDRLATEPIELDEGLRLVGELLEALAFAHRHGVIHRDIKPGNVLLSEGHAILADFGIARALATADDGLRTMSGTVIGTPAYMAPDHPRDEQADLYAAAVVAYEMLSGSIPVRGLTAEHLAGKLAERNKGLRVARAVGRVLARQLSMVPEARYASAAELRQAIAAAATTRQRSLAIAGTSAAVVAIGLLAWIGGRVAERRATTPVVADSTHLLVFPFDGDSVLGAAHDAALTDALTGWKGVSLVDHFQVADAIRRAGGRVDGPAARRIAASLGAGRYVRGTLGGVGDSLRVTVNLYDTGRDPPLYHVTADVPRNADAAVSAYARLAAGLLLQDEPDSAAAVPGRRRALPASQAFHAAMRALDAWNLDAADSLLERAIGFEPAFPLAQYKLAQVREWRRRPEVAWAALARAAADSAAEFSPRDRMLTLGLVALAAGDYAEACRTYAALRRQNPRDFAALFGAGQCVDLDRAVVRDAASPTGWRFATSYWAAVQAYLAAFRLLPSSLHAFQGSAFEAVRRLLYTTLAFRPGVAADSTRFVAMPEWQGDSLVFWPRPATEAQGAAGPVSAERMRAALLHQRRSFAQLAMDWSMVYPNAAGPKEAVALAFELLGDRSAADTLHAALALAPSRGYALRLAAMETLVRVKFAFPDSTVALRRARTVSDSLLRDFPDPRPAEALVLAPLAALTGRCDDARRLAFAATAAARSVARFAPNVEAEANGLVALAAGQCESPDRLRAALRALVARADAAAVSDQGLYSLAGLATRLIFPPDSAVVVRIARASGDYLLQAEAALLRRDTAAAFAPLRRVNAARAMVGEGYTTDAVAGEARAWLAFGDTAAARAAIDSAIASLGRQPPLVLDDAAIGVARAGSLLPLAALRAALATQSPRGPPARHRLAAAIDALADPSAVRRLTALAP